MPITRYCDDSALDIDERLALFAQVCDGVQHAHLRGIIHRDLKPSNILVAELDGKPAPKIIDFGIAKAIDRGRHRRTAHTRFGHLLGTPEYMSPEQAQLAPLDIDPRTDVYSLGVVLYELLTGSVPMDIARCDLAGALARGKSGKERCAARVTALLANVQAMLRGDLDWIMLKAIEKDRTRRYSSVQELASDLERHARNEPVLAGPPSWTYRAGRFVRRHRLAVALTASLLAAMLLFGTAMAWLARENARERDRANEEAEIARRVTAFTAELFGLASPEVSGDSEIPARELLDAGVGRLEGGALKDEKPEVRAALFEAAGDAYRSIGEFEKSSRLIDEAVSIRREREAEDPVAYGRALMRESLLRRDEGKFQESANFARQAIGLFDAAEIAGDAAAREALSDARVELAELLRRDSQLDEAATARERGRGGFRRARARHAKPYLGAVHARAGRAGARQPRGRRADAAPRLRPAEQALGRAFG